MPSAAKHLVFSATYEDEILRLPPQDDITTQSRERGKGKGEETRKERACYETHHRHQLNSPPTWPGIVNAKSTTVTANSTTALIAKDQ